MAWAMSLGARPWWALSTTVISAAIAAAVALPAAAAAYDPLARFLAALKLDHDGALSAASLRRACGSDLVCAAKQVIAATGRPARLEAVSHPDSDSIRWATTLPSVTHSRRLTDGSALIVLRRFGRKAPQELEAAFAGQASVVLDLRSNGGGDFHRMLALAGVFTGALTAALQVIDGAEMTRYDIPAPRQTYNAPLTVLIGPRTASSGEILAGLLRRYAGAALVGETTAGKDYLYRIVPLDHDWRLLWPGGTVTIPGETLSGGLRPDRPLDPLLAAELGP